MFKQGEEKRVLGLFYSILAVAVVSLSSLAGVFVMSLKKDTLDKILFVLVSFSAGSILGAAYLDLLPEAIEFLGEEQLSITVLYVTLGFLISSSLNGLSIGTTTMDMGTILMLRKNVDKTLLLPSKSLLI